MKTRGSRRSVWRIWNPDSGWLKVGSKIGRNGPFAEVPDLMNDHILESFCGDLVKKIWNTWYLYEQDALVLQVALKYHFWWIFVLFSSFWFLFFSFSIHPQILNLPNEFLYSYIGQRCSQRCILLSPGNNHDIMCLLDYNFKKWFQVFLPLLLYHRVNIW